MEAVPREDGAPSKFRHCVVLGLIVAAAAFLRLWGIRWGLPNALHDYSYHPDEFLTVGSAFGSIYLLHSLNPRLYNYPSLYIYLSALAIAVGLGWGMSPTLADIYLCARLVTVVMGTAAVVVTWWAGRILIGNLAGVLAALVVCLAPLHVQHSHFATVDVPSTLFVAAALGYCGLVLKQGRWRDYALAGVMCGLAAGTKYNAGLVALSLVAAHFGRDGIRWRALRSLRLWAGLVCTAAAFVISTPGAVLWPREFLHGLTYEMRHAATGHGLVFAGTGSGFVYTFTSSLLHGLGPVFAVLFAIALVRALWRRDKPCLVMLAFVVPYYVLISLSQVRFARYTLPLFPPAAVLIGALLADWYSRTRRAPAAGMPEGGGLRSRRRVWLVASLAMFYIAAMDCVALDLQMSGPDPRDQAAEWMLKHVPRGATIAVEEWPWFYTPPLSKNLGFGSLHDRQRAASKAPYKFVILSETAGSGANWAGHDADWAIITHHEICDANRLAHRKRGLSRADREKVERIERDVNLIGFYFVQRVSFSGAFHSSLPHDMSYANPFIQIYERKR